MGDAAWDRLGVAFGVVSCGSIAWQVLHEWRTPGPSSVSFAFVSGFLVVYLFWCLYGLRFRRRAIWLTNGIATGLQLALAGVIVWKMGW